MNLDIHEYEPYVWELQPGETTNLNHVECPAGEDTKYRLYFTRPTGERNVLLVYCHNCQQGTKIHIKDNYRLPKLDAPAKLADTNTDFRVPHGTHFNEEHWPPGARAWVWKNFGSDGRNPLGWDPSTNRVYIPIFEEFEFFGNQYQTANVLQGYQLRLVEGSGNKYLTVKRNKEYEPFSLLCDQSTLTKGIVIVEDLASGFTLMKEREDIEVYVNYGVQVKIERLLEVAQRELPVLVWFDNDNDHVRQQAERICRTLLTLGCPRAIPASCLDLDPKNATPHQIEEQLDWIL